MCHASWDSGKWWWIVFVVWLTDEGRLATFPAGIIVRDPHHPESPTRREIPACINGLKNSLQNPNYYNFINILIPYHARE